MTCAGAARYVNDARPRRRAARSASAVTRPACSKRRRNKPTRPGRPRTARPAPKSNARSAIVETCGVRSDFRPPPHPKLGEELRNVVLDLLLGQEHALGDLTVRETLPDALKQLPLLRREPAERVGLVVAVTNALQHPGRQQWINQPLGEACRIRPPLPVGRFRRVLPVSVAGLLEHRRLIVRVERTPAGPDRPGIVASLASCLSLEGPRALAKPL